MIAIDWETFAARVPAGAHVRWKTSSWGHRDAVLLETSPYIDYEHVNETEFLSQIFTREKWLRVQPFIAFTDFLSIKMEAETLEYLIDGQWLTFTEIMTNA